MRHRHNDRNRFCRYPIIGLRTACLKRGTLAICSGMAHGESVFAKKLGRAVSRGQVYGGSREGGE